MPFPGKNICSHDIIVKRSSGIRGTGSFIFRKKIYPEAVYQMHRILPGCKFQIQRKKYLKSHSNIIAESTADLWYCILGQGNLH